MRLRRGIPLWPALTLTKIHRRDGTHCPHCGAPATTVQHRGRRGSGGSNEAERPSNGIGLCFAANDADANEAGVRPEFEAMGWSLSRYEEPTAVAFYDVTTMRWWALDDQWGRRPSTGRSTGVSKPVDHNI